MKGQVAFEFLVVVGIVFAFLIPIWLYTNTLQAQSSDDLGTRLAHNALKKITGTADLVGSQGQPARAVLDVAIPKRVASVNITGKTIIMKMETLAGISDVAYTASTNLNGTLPTSEGLYKIYVEARNGFVQIGNVG